MVSATDDPLLISGCDQTSDSVPASASPGGSRPSNGTQQTGFYTAGIGSQAQQALRPFGKLLSAPAFLRSCRSFPERHFVGVEQQPRPPVGRSGNQGRQPAACRLNGLRQVMPFANEGFISGQTAAISQHQHQFRGVDFPSASSCFPHGNRFDQPVVDPVFVYIVLTHPARKPEHHVVLVLPERRKTPAAVDDHVEPARPAFAVAERERTGHAAPAEIAYQQINIEMATPGVLQQQPRDPALQTGPGGQDRSFGGSDLTSRRTLGELGHTVGFDWLHRLLPLIVLAERLECHSEEKGHRRPVYMRHPWF